MNTQQIAAGEAAREKWNSIAKPLGSLGLLEDAIVRIAALTGSADVRLEKRCVLVLCADNGIVAEGVTQTDSSVTMSVARNLVRRQTSVCRMAAAARADVYPVDMGMNTHPDFAGMIDMRVGVGTANFAKKPAMTREQAAQAVENGIALAEDMKSRGYDIIATGEMGIGNTTTSSALCAALLNLPVENVTGRGSGLSDEGLQRKIDTIKRGIALHITKPANADFVNTASVGTEAAPDALGVLAALGGFDIAGMAGIFLGGARAGIPVLIDGFISAIAALVAMRLDPDCASAMLASHVSGEPAGLTVLAALGLKPLITAEMRLGEGTGAVAALPLLDLALAVYHGSSSFADIGVEQYVPM